MKRAAIIGCGTIFQVHLPIIVANPEIELCAVCDNNPAVQEKLPAAAKAVPFYTDYEELLEKEHPDVVHLCLPHYLHVPVSEYFASHGVNVFCEKPVGLNTAQAKEFVEFEAAHPEVKIGICLQNRLNRTTVELKKIIDGGEYGKVIGCRGFVPWFRGKAYYDEQPWRGQLETAGGGCMINQSVHTLDLLYYLCGDIDAIHGSVNQLADYGIEVEDTVAARLPFDARRGGFVMGEGSGVLVLEELEHARARGAHIYAEVVGYGANCDAYHFTAPAPGGTGAIDCMKLTLADAGIAPEQVDHINAHGTGTHMNDACETAAIHAVFGAHAKEMTVVSTKSMTGHLLGGAGGIEAVFTALALRDQFAPPTIHYAQPDPECDLDYVPNTGRQQEMQYALSNSLGFGGHNACIALRRWEG